MVKKVAKKENKPASAKKGARKSSGKGKTAKPARVAKQGSTKGDNHEALPAEYRGPRHTNRPPALASATLRNTRISARKAKLVVDMVRGMQVEPALQALRFSPKKGARLVEKLLRSAISNAVERAGADVDKLWITGGFADTGRSMKRMMPRAQGRGDIINKKSAHITIFLGERI